MAHAFFGKAMGVLIGLAIAFVEVSSARATDGSQDPTFGNDGIVTTDIRGNDDLGLDVAVQPDGKVLVAGTSANSDGANNDFALARYNEDGSLDTTFDVDGIVNTDIGDYDQAVAIALQADGKIIAAGHTNNGADHDFALARYNPDGSLDPTFDLDGKVITSIGMGNDYGTDVALQADGKIVVAGFSFNDTTSGDNLVLVRYEADGSLDESFGSAGKVTTGFGCAAAGQALTLQPDGMILVAGSTCGAGGQDFALARYNSDGSPDPMFGSDGLVTTDFENSYDSASTMALQPDGRIVLAGYSYTDPNVNVVFALARYNGDGLPDSTFDRDGKVTSDLGGWRDSGQALSLQPDGKILVAGEQWQQGGTVDFALARYNTDGSLDPSFGTDGSVITDLGGSGGDYAAAVARQSDGRILVAGWSDNGFNFDFALVPYHTEGIANTITVLVPATANPWLAGMPDGTLSHFGDSAPANSPAEVRGLSLTPGTSVFFSATGLVSHGSPEDPLIQTSGPDGGTTVLSHNFGSENGISDVQAPINGLMGVFLGPDQPDSFPPPEALDFNSSVNRDYRSLSPELQQVFFIGDGLTSAGQLQEIVVPAGATRLFIGSMDASQYNNNQGSFTVHISMTLQVTVDIRPGKFPNRIELEKNLCEDDNNLPVAILTTPEFDALRLVDATSLQIGDPALGGTAAPVHSQGRDIDLDGDRDVWLLFALCDLVSNNALDGNSTELVLTGSTLEGGTFTARDSVEIIGHKPPKPIVPEFLYPVDGQVLDYEGSYLFKVKPIPSAESFLWGFFQYGVMVWENYRDEGILSGNEYGIHPGTLAHSKFVPGPVEVWVRASIKGQWTDAAVITIHLQPRNDFLDPAFGNGGIVTTDFAGYGDFGYGAALQSDGKILVSGSVHNGLDSDFGLARYNSDGSLDTTFGTDGMVTTDVSSCCLININTASVALLETLPGIGPTTAQWIVDYRNANGPFQKFEDIVNVPGTGPGTFDRIKDLITFGNDSGQGVALQPDGRIIVVGGSNNDFALARYNSDGSPDTTFGSDGRVLTDVGENYGIGISVALQPDGKILVSGFGGTVINFVLVRYNDDGSPDTTFGDNGIVITHISGEDFGRVLALQPDGKIIVAGQSWVQGKGYNFTLVRYNSDGSLDTAFGMNGIVSTGFEGSFEDNISAILLQPDGKIIAAGSSDADGIFKFALARYHSDGSLDKTFGADGKITTPFPFNDAYGNAAALQPDGRIIVAGQYFMPDVGYTFAVARYLPDGSLDIGFGTDGKITTDFGSGDSWAYAVLLPSDGRIVAVGHSFTGASFDFALAAYQVGGSPMKVPIDIKPGSRTNHVNPKSRGRIHVAILSTPEFDALTMIDRPTIRFGRTGEEESLHSCKEKGRDVNHDGLKDLVCVFSIQESGFQQGDEIGILTAQTVDGVAVVGHDSIRVVRKDDD